MVAHKTPSVDLNQRFSVRPRRSNICAVHYTLHVLGWRYIIKEVQSSDKTPSVLVIKKDGSFFYPTVEGMV